MTLKEKIRYGAMAAILVILLLFVFFNLDSVSVNIVFGKVSMPVAFVMIFSFLMGVGATWIWMLVKPRFTKKPE